MEAKKNEPDYITAVFQLGLSYNIPAHLREFNPQRVLIMVKLHRL